MIGRTYLDWNATAPLRPEARAAVVAALDELGNPSSVHREGRAARRLVEVARQQVAALVGAEPRNVVFTSGGTESRNRCSFARASDSDSATWIRIDHRMPTSRGLRPNDTSFASSASRCCFMLATVRRVLNCMSA